MDRRPEPTRYRIFLLQLQLVITGMTFIALMPPARGTMVAIPLFASTRVDGVAGLLRAGARILRPGPVSGSLVLSAERNAILPAALANGILLLPTGLLGCAAPEAAA